MITVTGLRKTYRVHKRPPGLGAALRSVFHRQYELVEALRDVSFSIAAGECVGFLGPNGAGKTTTLKILSGLLHPSDGQVQVAGYTPKDRVPAFLKTITLVMGQKQQLLWDLPPSETYAMNRALYDIPRREAEETLAELVSLLDISTLIGKPARQLSLGERMRCELAAALLHRPKVLFLDEPTIGLDVAMQLRMREFVRSYNQRFGATVLLTSHYMDDVAALCKRVVVIDKGRVVYDGALDALARRLRPEKRVTVRLSQPASADVVARLGRIIEHSDGKVIFSVPAATASDAVRSALQSLAAADLSVEDPPLEEVMRELYQGTATDQVP